REQVVDLQSERQTWSAFGGEVAAYLVDGRLPAREVVIVTQEGTDTLAIDAARRALQAAGAEVAAVLSVDPSLSLEREADVTEVARLVGSPHEDPEAVAADAAAALAARLVSGSGPTDVLEGFLASGFLLNRGPGLGAAAVRALGGRDQIFLMVAGGEDEPAVDPAWFLAPLTRELARSGASVGAAEPADTEYSFVGILRGDAAVSRLLVTQDNVDQVPGEVGLVLGLQDLVVNGRPGHYGVKDGADAVIPPLP
ncbi:MAG TPA: copper transporter, partial [Actinomycetota bacterium]|nr:copper transporter [Actinomycetota bacterium]